LRTLWSSIWCHYSYLAFSTVSSPGSSTQTILRNVPSSADTAIRYRVILTSRAPECRYKSVSVLIISLISFTWSVIITSYEIRVVGPTMEAIIRKVNAHAPYFIIRLINILLVFNIYICHVTLYRYTFIRGLCSQVRENAV